MLLPDMKIPFTLEDIHKAYDTMLPYAMSFFYFFDLPLMVNSPIVGDGPDREQRAENMMWRGKCILDDVIELFGEKK